MHKIFTCIKTDFLVKYGIKIQFLYFKTCIFDISTAILTYWLMVKNNDFSRKPERVLNKAERNRGFSDRLASRLPRKFLASRRPYRSSKFCGSRTAIPAYRVRNEEPSVMPRQAFRIVSAIEIYGTLRIGPHRSAPAPSPLRDSARVTLSYRCRYRYRYTAGVSIRRHRNSKR